MDTVCGYHGYPNTPTKALSRLLRRSESSVYQCARNLGLRKSAEYLAGPDACRLRRGDNIGAAVEGQEVVPISERLMGGL